MLTAAADLKLKVKLHGANSIEQNAVASLASAAAWSAVNVF